ncbi:YhfC family intramembrane metalloprotease [Bacillus sp. FJAT-49732]|uniref:YhfC family intramembrane metalloprotease n=1 Tax=Lederbergia citrisecunda TaxID=2833583 RepID=A0A942TS00_9BACI|nr:YhfC family intramembrane metalloprotease [Lederbergia citrisecunda]MBS4200759.1 YhfC family intramembrane metalloprotease [Lederbergia citrisecunda]
MVSSGTLVSLIMSFIIAIGTPIFLLVFFKKRYKISLIVLLIGMATFFLFASVLEGLLHSYFLVWNKSTKQFFENPWLFMLYGGLMAGIFEETGRFIMMKFALKKYREWKDGLAFGLGHGGMEAILLVGVNSIVMIVFAFMINNGTFDSLLMSDQTKEAMTPIKDQLTNGSSFIILLGGIERLSALSIHLGLSILVMYAIRSRKILFFFLAIIIHAVFDFPAALYQVGVIKNIYIVELLIAIIAAGSIYWVVKSRKLFKDEM